MIRAGAAVWPPLDLPHLPRLLPGFATVALAMSSAVLQRAVNHSRRGPATTGRSALVATAALLGAIFLGLQMIVWRHLWLDGLRPESGTYASAFFGLTVFHALHVVVGVLALAWLSLRKTAHRTALRLWALYWHMVGVVWAIMFLLLYLV